MMGNTTRRNILTGAVALAAVRASGVAINATASSPIERLWARAQAIKSELASLQAPFAVIGAHELVGQRYAVLGQILRSRPASKRDRAILELASADGDIRHRLAGWANIRVANAGNTMRSAALA